jgi:hypothetical protein
MIAGHASNAALESPTRSTERREWVASKHMALIDSSSGLAETRTEGREIGIDTPQQRRGTRTDIARWCRIESCAVFEEQMRAAGIEQPVGSGQDVCNGISHRRDTRFQRDDMRSRIARYRFPRTNGEARRHATRDQHGCQLDCTRQIVCYRPE